MIRYKGLILTHAEWEIFQLGMQVREGSEQLASLVTELAIMSA